MSATAGATFCLEGVDPIEVCGSGFNLCPIECDYTDIDCHENHPSWNAKLGTCVAPRDAICGIVGQANIGLESYGSMRPDEDEGTRNATESESTVHG